MGNIYSQLDRLNQLEDKNIKSFVKLARRVLKTKNPSRDVPEYFQKDKKVKKKLKKMRTKTIIKKSKKPDKGDT